MSARDVQAPPQEGSHPSPPCCSSSARRCQDPPLAHEAVSQDRREDATGGPEKTSSFLLLKGMDGAIGSKTVTYDLARLMEGAKEVSCSAFGDALIARMG